MDAVMAGAALVACADGNVSSAKRTAVAKILERIDTGKDFDVRAANNLLDSFANRIRSQPDQGRREALNAVAAVAEVPDRAQLLVQICWAVSQADGVPSTEAVARIEEISAALGVSSSAFAKGAFSVLDRKGLRSYLIAIGNEKGGTGKSTTAMHVAVALLRLGYSVGTIDLDSHQGTLSRYLQNRVNLARAKGGDIPVPAHQRIERSKATNRDAAHREEKARLQEAFYSLADRQVIVIDTPGSDCYLSRLGHLNADMLITPINDTLIDVDILARIDRDKRQVLAPSPYSEMVWEQNQRRVSNGRHPIDWIVMRNRLTHIDAHNKREIAGLLRQLGKRIGFRLAPGFSERVIYHELFLSGLTLLDLPQRRAQDPSYMSHVHAREEIQGLLAAIGVPDLNEQTGTPTMLELL